MKALRMLVAIVRTLLALVFFVVAIPICALVAFPWTFITGRIWFLYFLGTGFAYLGVRIAGVKIKLVGLDKIDPAGTYIFMSNHVSNLDPPVLVPMIPRRTSVLAKKELWRIPILGQALQLAEIVPVDRKDRESAIDSVHRAAEVMQHGINMTIYPEGTRSPDGRLLPFKKGPFHLAFETGFPVVPITVLGTAELMPIGSNVIRGGTATLVFHPPIDPKNFSSREELMQAVQVAIESALPEAKKTNLTTD